MPQLAAKSLDGNLTATCGNLPRGVRRQPDGNLRQLAVRGKLPQVAANQNIQPRGKLSAPLKVSAPLKPSALLNFLMKSARGKLRQLAATCRAQRAASCRKLPWDAFLMGKKGKQTPPLAPTFPLAGLTITYTRSRQAAASCRYPRTATCGNLPRLARCPRQVAATCGNLP